METWVAYANHSVAMQCYFEYLLHINGFISPVSDLCRPFGVTQPYMRIVLVEIFHLCLAPHIFISNALHISCLLCLTSLESNSHLRAWEKVASDLRLGFIFGILVYFPRSQLLLLLYTDYYVLV